MVGDGNLAKVATIDVIGRRLDGINNGVQNDVTYFAARILRLFLFPKFLNHHSTFTSIFCLDFFQYCFFYGGSIVIVIMFYFDVFLSKILRHVKEVTRVCLDSGWESLKCLIANNPRLDIPNENLNTLNSCKCLIRVPLEVLVCVWMSV